MTELDAHDLLEKALDAPAGDAKPGSEDGEDRKARKERKEKKRRDRSRSRSKGGRSRSPRRHRSRDDHRSSHRRHDDRHRSRDAPRAPEVDEATVARERAERREAEARLREAEAAERDTRTVFAYNLPTKANERDVFEFFAPAGPVSDVRIIYDRNTSRSKGMAYVEMLDRTTVGAALGLSGSQLRGQMVMVKASEAEKNIAWQAEKASKAAVAAVTATAAGNGAAIEALGGAPAQLRVAGLHSGLDASDVRSVFSPFGPLAACALDPSTPGEADVVFVNARDAGHALSQLHGMELAGCALRLSLAPLTALPPPPFASTPAILAASLAAQAAAAGSLGGGHDLDDSAEGGVRMDARGRAALMARLAGGAAATLTPGANGAGAGGMPGALGILGSAGIDPVTGRPVPLAAPAAPPPGPAPPAVVAANVRSIQGVLGPPSPIPTECVLLKNMFSPAEETEPNWWLDIQEDVAAECAKHGAVKHCWVDKASDGFIYLKFGAVAHAAAALAAMQGRWFAGRQVVAEFQFTAVYNSHFKPDAAAAAGTA